MRCFRPAGGAGRDAGTQEPELELPGENAGAEEPELELPGEDASAKELEHAEAHELALELLGWDAGAQRSRSWGCWARTRERRSRSGSC